MGYYMPIDLYFSQYIFAIKMSEMYKESRQNDKAKEYKDIAENILKKRAKIMNKNK